MAQPSAPNSRQSGPEAKKANMDALHTLKPGGPILPATQPFGKPNPTDRGKENAARERDVVLWDRGEYFNGRSRP